MTGADLRPRSTGRPRSRLSPPARRSSSAWPFVGEGTVAGYWPRTRSPRPPKANQGKFKWINHTYDHTNLDAVTYDAGDDADQPEQQGGDPGWGSAPTTRRTSSSPTSRASGTTSRASMAATVRNEEFLRAAYDAGVRNLITDTSRAPYFNPGANGPNEGTWLTGTGYDLFGVARYPVSLYFNVSTPDQWLAEDNCLYPAGAPFGHVDTYAAAAQPGVGQPAPLPVAGRQPSADVPPAQPAGLRRNP